MNSMISRKAFIKSATMSVAGLWVHQTVLGNETKSEGQTITPRIDTHTHFYDPARPQGVPWPSKEDSVLYRTVMPKDYQVLPKPQPVTGTVVVEASPWVEDNQWILDLAAQEPFIRGLVGNLPIGTEHFPENLKRFSANPIFRGIRARPTPSRQSWEAASFIADLKLLAERNLSLDLVGGGEILEIIPKLAAKIPSLRIVIDHLAGVRIDGRAPDPAWRQMMQTAAKHPNVYAKVSGLVEGSGQQGGKAPRNTAFYQPTIEAMWEMFGEDRLLYGSNWPVCELYSDLATVQRIVTDFFTAKGVEPLAKVFWKNARRVY